MFRKFKEASRETKWFAFNWAIYLILVLVTTVYVYARLEYVRSDAKNRQEISNEK